MGDQFLSKERELVLGGMVQSYLAIKEGYDDSTATQEDKEIYANGITAIDELVTNHMRLVYKLAYNFHRKYPGAGSIDDLIQDGFLGLMKAVLRYDPKRGNKFSTVAVMWVQQNMGRTANETSRLVRLPENRIADLIKMNTIEADILDLGGSQSEVDETIVSELGITLHKVHQIRAASLNHASLNKVVTSVGESSKELGEFFEDESSDGSVEDNVLKDLMFSTVSDIISDTLSQEEKAVLGASFDLDIEGEAPKSVRETKDLLGLSNVKYKKILDRAVKKLSESVKKLGLTSEDFLMSE